MSEMLLYGLVSRLNALVSIRTCLLITCILCGVLSCSKVSDAGNDSENLPETADGDSDSSLDDLTQYMEDGFVSIEPGAFVLGSPETEAPDCRAKYNEDQVDVILTHAFEIARTEVTQGQWKAAGFQNPVESNSSFSAVLDDELPVTLVDWYEVLAFCNELSKTAGLETCYNLNNCTGDNIGNGCPPPNEHATWENGGCSLWEGANPYSCGYPVRRFESMYECKGYRLPTSAEWEYAARAGTTQATYNGEIQHSGEDCYIEPALEPIAWYCGNTSDGIYRRVGLKKPNPWGLYDMLGNVYEWTDAIYTGGGLEEDELYATGQTPPLIDPMGHIDDGKLRERILRGRSCVRPGCFVRAAQVFGGYDTSKRFRTIGFRPVRTLQ